MVASGRRKGFSDGGESGEESAAGTCVGREAAAMCLAQRTLPAPLIRGSGHVQGPLDPFSRVSSLLARADPSTATCRPSDWPVMVRRGPSELCSAVCVLALARGLLGSGPR